mmetsp:Transcript_23791/g.30955  ORF Transcript_23791/g.30955 Transcript_23791/m.30955 type:complete len:544 (+) Transcript_23791:58-1689(+)
MQFEDEVPNDMGGSHVQQERHYRMLKLYAALASLNSVSLGTAIGLVTQISPLVKDAFNLGGTEVSCYQASLGFFGIFGALSASTLMDPYGRLPSFVIASAAFLLGTGIVCSANGYVWLMIGTAIIGWASGVGLSIDAIYIAELSTRLQRGYFVTYSEIAISLGQLFGFACGFTVDISYGLLNKWRIIAACGAIPPALLLIAVTLILPESPRWLAVNGEPQKAKDVLIYALDVPQDDAEKLVHFMLHDKSVEITSHERGDPSAPLRENNKPSFIAFYLLFSAKTPAPIRLAIIIAVGVAASQMICGIDVITYNFSFFMASAGMTSSSMISGLIVVYGGIKLLAAIISANIIDKTGRRPLLVFSSISITFIICAISISFGLATPSLRGTAAFVTIIISLVYTHVFCFEIGLGPGCWLIPSEILFNKIRLPAMGLCTTTNRIITTLLVSTSFVFRDRLGWSGLFVWLTFTSAIGAIFLITQLPETAGKSLEEMYAYFESLSFERRQARASLLGVVVDDEKKRSSYYGSSSAVVTPLLATEADSDLQ